MRTLTLSLAIASFFPRHSHPLILSRSLASLAGWDQSIVGESTRVKANKAWDWPRSSRLLRLTEFLTIVMNDRQRLRYGPIAKHDILGASFGPIQMTTDTGFDATKCVIIIR